MSKPKRLDEAKWKILVSGSMDYFALITTNDNIGVEDNFEILFDDFLSSKKALNAAVRFCKLNNWKYEIVE